MKNLNLLSLIVLLTLTIAGCTTTVDETYADREKELENKITEDETLESLEKTVKNIIAKVDSATPSGTVEENRTKFFDLKSELDTLENELDSHEDYLETQYNQDLISYEEYRAQEKELEKLENDLENAEDRLEMKFRIDD